MCFFLKACLYLCAMMIMQPYGFWPIGSNATCSGYFLDSGHWTLQHGDVSCKTEGSLVLQVHYMLCNVHSMIELLECIVYIYIYMCILYMYTRLWWCKYIKFTYVYHYKPLTNQQTIHAFFPPPSRWSWIPCDSCGRWKGTWNTNHWSQGLIVGFYEKLKSGQRWWQLGHFNIF